jgi:spermidine/putrescine transport system permease protein
MTKRTSAFLRQSVLTLTILFLFTPIIVLVLYSFSTRGFPYPIGAMTLDWYRALLKESELWISFMNSLIIATSASTICALMAILMIAHQHYGGSIKKSIPLFYSNLIIPETILAISLLNMFSYFNLALGMKAITIAHTLIGLGLSIPILYNRFCDIDKDIIEASYSLGASKFQTFMKIVFPIMLPTLITTSAFVFILSFDDFILSYFVSSQSTQTLSLYLISSLKTGIEPTANALSLILIITSLLLFVLCLKKRGIKKIR